MKLFAVGWIGALAACKVIAQEISPSRGPAHCYLEATNVSNFDEIRNNWQDDWGSFDRDHFHRVVLKIRAGTTDHTGGPVKIAWFWIGRRMIDNELTVYGLGGQQLQIPAAYFKECYAAAPELGNREVNLPAINRRYVSGAKYEGWIVTVSDSNNQMMQVKASSEPLRQLYLNQAEFSKLLP